MTKARIDSNFSKAKGQVIFEYILLAICLCVIAIRTTFTEGLNAQSAGQPFGLGDSVYSLSMSAVLIVAFVVWFVWNFCGGRGRYRFTAIEIGLCLFILAAIVAGFSAANKRAAITNFATMLAPILMAVLLVQILDSHSKIKLVLCVIVALGVVSAYQCADQLLYSNEQLIKFYEQNQDAALAQQGITPNSLRQWQFEHRLYSKDVRGFFTTSNSAGSFAMLASFAAIALFIDKFGNRKFRASGLLSPLTCGIAAVIVIFGLAITKSKGALTASLMAAAMFAAYLLFGKWLKVHKKAILLACLLLGLTGGCVVAWYGLTHDRLPGGSSMLVRWQYWRASAKMYADHLFAGVGPGNFVNFYPHYKPASALETVTDPHNFLLSVLTQYGPLGLVGFLAMILVPLGRVIFPGPALLSPKAHRPEPASKLVPAIFLIVISAALLVIRPMILIMPSAGTRIERMAAIIILYVVPAVVFIIGFLLLMPAQHTKRNMQYAIRNTDVTAALFCACLGLLFHNLIDFAIFEPGVFTAFWAIIACVVAMGFHQKSRLQFVLKPAPFVRILAAAGGVVIIWAYFNYALVPVARASAKTKLAMQQPGYASELLHQAAEDDRLDTKALNLNGRLYLQRHSEMEKKQPALLEQAEKCFLAAIERDNADYKNYEKLSAVYNLLAEVSTQQAKTGWLNKAFDSALFAVERYPGSGRLRIELAKSAEQLGKTDIAIEQYKKAIDIEDSYRRQFQLMYPDREIFSRLGEEKYQFAKWRIKLLCP